MDEKPIIRIANIIARDNQSLIYGNIHPEGITNDGDRYVYIFDFEYNGKTEIIKLTKKEYNVIAFRHCFFLGYKFSDCASCETRTAFVNSIRFPDGRMSNEDVRRFIITTVNSLDKDISLPSFDIVVYPESISELNRNMLGYLNRLAQPQVVNMDAIKSLPSKIGFDYDRFEIEVLQSKLPDGRYRYTDKEKAEVLIYIQAIMDYIHDLDYFAISKGVIATRHLQHIHRYYKFGDKRDKRLYESIMKNNVLIIDDTATPSSTIFTLLKCLRLVNESNKIVIFNLIGKNIQ